MQGEMILKTRIGVWFLVLAWSFQAWGIGYVYTGVGGGGREWLELTSVVVDVDIQDRVAVTRADQVFTNHSRQELEGIYEFSLPDGAIITDLVLWIGDRRVQGQIMEKEEARRTYDEIVGRQIDPALIEQIEENQFRLSIFPFPAEGSRRVELEYMQILESRSGTMEYRFPLMPESDQPLRMERFILRAAVRGQHPFAVSVVESFEPITDIQQTGEFAAEVLFADEQVSPQHDFRLIVAETVGAVFPKVLSFAPQDGGEFGYYALWLPPLRELSTADPIPRSLTFVIDISSSMQGRLTAVKGALAAAIEDLTAEDSFNVIVYSNHATAFVPDPVEATAENKEKAIAFVNRQSPLGATNFEEALQMALRQAFPGERLHHVIFLTDGHPTFGETDLTRLDQMVDELAGNKTRIFTIGVGRDLNRGFLRALAEDHLGATSFLSDESDIETRLRALFAEFSRPVFLPSELVFEGVEIHDVFPRGIDVLATGEELFQVGRYPRGGEFTLRLNGRVHGGDLSLEDHSLEYHLEFAEVDTSLRLIPRLWAHQKVQALEGQIARFGPLQEMLDDILDLGLTYRLVTRRTSLFAPDEEVIVNPQPEEEDVLADAATAVEEAMITASWLGKTFYLHDERWIDAEFETSMRVVEYDPNAGHPGALDDFARLGQDMIVVVKGTAYELRRGILPAQPVLLQNVPNPFNASTLIRFAIPASFVKESLRLAIYNLAGQQVATLVEGRRGAGEYIVRWDGTDDSGNQLASGVYVYRLEAGERLVETRKLALVR